MSGGLSSGDLFGDFEILGVAGEGGMGVVYKARQRSLRRIVALKVIAPKVATDLDFQKRFEHESRLAASIDHPHVVAVYAAGEQDGRAYIAMQWIEGTNLASAIPIGGIGEERVVTIVGQVAGALDAAHATGLVHRDVKPANVLLRKIAGTDFAYLTDFGIAKQTTVAAGGLTKTGFLIGTPGYLAPEQLRGEHGDHRSDIYALGCVLFEALTGKSPFQRDNDMAMIWAHGHDPRPAPSAVRADLARYDDVVAKAMAIETDDRFSSGSELAAAAGAALLSRSSLLAAAPTVLAPSKPARPPAEQTPPPDPPTPTPATATPTPATAIPAPSTDPARSTPSNRAPLIAAITIGLIAAAIAIIVLAGGNSGGGEAPSGSTTANPAEADRGGNDGSLGANPSDQAEIVSVLKSYAAAYSQRSIGAIDVLLAADVTRHGLRGGGCSETSGRPAVLQTYQEQFRLNTGAYSLPDLASGDVRLVGDGNAAVQTAYHIEPSADGSVFFELVRSDERWLISRIDANC